MMFDASLFMTTNKGPGDVNGQDGRRGRLIEKVNEHQGEKVNKVNGQDIGDQEGR